MNLRTMSNFAHACWRLMRADGNSGRQQEDDLSFIGGSPSLLPDTALPRCQLCHSQLTFYFQVAFPDGHLWQHHSLAVFACTMCWDRRFVIPTLFEKTSNG